MFLGHVVSKYGITPDPDKIEAVSRYIHPKDCAQLRTFLGMID